MRKAGVLLPMTSLASEYGIGCISKSAYDFVDFLADSGQSYWQMLPINPTSYGDSPYQSPSAFAANPYFVSLEGLIREGLLTKDECESADFGSGADDIDYKKMYTNRYPLLRKAYTRSNHKNTVDYKSFLQNHADWLDDYAIFMALKNHFGTGIWTDWTVDIRLRRHSSLEMWTQKLADEINFWKFVQYKFFTEWYKLKKYANENGISLIGDIPIYTSLDSVDVWANPSLFLLDDDCIPTFVAGCPPDGFSKTGQLWGNPIYNWQNHKKEGYLWWKKRLTHCLDLFDVVRIDHFRGFDEYYAIPYGSIDATGGEWKKGPGIELFKALGKVCSEDKIIAEDLGFITDSVKKLLADTGFAGIKVLEFAFDSRDSGGSIYLPHNYPDNCVAYTGTHDNQTLAGWLGTISESEIKNIREYLCDFYTPTPELYKPLVALALSSRAKICIIPMQDYLGLDDSARINKPSTTGTNWRWRLTKNQLTDSLSDDMKSMAKRYGRI